MRCLRIAVVIAAHLDFLFSSRLPFMFSEAIFTPCVLPMLFHKVSLSFLSLVIFISLGVKFLVLLGGGPLLLLASVLAGLEGA